MWIIKKEISLDVTRMDKIRNKYIRGTPQVREAILSYLRGGMVASSLIVKPSLDPYQITTQILAAEARLIPA